MLHHTLCIAPMLNLTDRHCRYFHRLLTHHALLYTEMVTTGALIHGDVARYLRHHVQEHPVALQLGGNDCAELAQCARLAEKWAYVEVNLNCGCPSEQVQRGAFGACLMKEPHQVADCVKAMRDAVAIDVTVKLRIGIDRIENYDFVRDFVGTISLAGCNTFIVHARNAWLQGLSPKENREVPPLRYEQVYRLKKDFPHLQIVINGGVHTTDQIQSHLQQVDGVMVGREAYDNPWWLSDWDATFFGSQEQRSNPMTREFVEQQMVAYMLDESAHRGTAWPFIARHMLGLRHKLPGARRWRQVWSDHTLKNMSPELVMQMAQKWPDGHVGTGSVE
jgi:tRNA-dihydrouridine synthase A